MSLDLLLFMFFYQAKKSLHLLLIASATVVAISLCWHFGISSLEPSPQLALRLTGLVCLVFAVFQYHRLYSQEDVITKGTRLISPKKFNSLIKGDGIGIPFDSSLRRNNKSTDEPSLMRIRASDHSSHMMILGDTGTGKSALQHTILRQIREETTDAAIIYDPSAEFYRYHSQKGDILLHPFAKDAPYWSITDEIQNNSDAQALAKSFIPDRVDGKPEFWELAPRKLLGFLLMKLKEEQLTTTDLVRWIADGELLNDMVAGTALEPLIDPGANAQRAGVLATLSLISDALSLLPPNDGKRPIFSFRQWSKTRDGFIFIPTIGTRERVALRPLVSVFLDTAFNCLMDKNDARPCWVFVDEMPSLQKLPSLETALYESRKYGVRFCLGFQGRSQLKALYGMSAEAIMSSSTTRIFLRTNEYEAAQWISNNIGRPERKRNIETFSSSLLSNGRDSISSREELKSDYLVLPNEIQVLPKLSGYLVYSGYAVKFDFPYPKLVERNQFQEAGKG